MIDLARRPRGFSSQCSALPRLGAPLLAASLLPSVALAQSEEPDQPKEPIPATAGSAEPSPSPDGEASGEVEPAAEARGDEDLGPASTEPADSGKDCVDEERDEPWARRRRATLAVGGFWAPDSSFGKSAGVALGGNGFGDDHRRYEASYFQLELGNGIGFESGGYRLYNLLELDAPVSVIVGGHLLDINAEVSSRSDSRDYIAWSMHADGGLRVGNKESCFGSATLGVGFNSGTQSLGKGDWFRRETGAMVTAVCGPVHLGGALRHIDDDFRGTVAHASASAVVFLTASKAFGIGATYSVTAFDPDPTYRSLYDEPMLAFDSDLKQTMLRITLQTSTDAWDHHWKKHRKKHGKKPEEK